MTPFEKILTAAEKASMRGELFASCDLIAVDLSGADLRGAHFEKTLMWGCNLARADLRGASFRLCDLRSLVLADTIFGDNRFDGTTIVEPVGLNAAMHTLIQRCGGTFQPARASRR